ncbi:MAG: rRNA maturation RNase YbeY [Christensenellaceae bacterium]
MKITLSEEQEKLEFTQDMKDAVQKTLDEAQKELGTECCVSVLITDDDGIQGLNKEFREVDSATDVLSFPTYDLKKPLKDCMSEIDTEMVDGCVFLGDLAVSLERAQKQAHDYGHSLIREVAFLALHGTLHLMGYDHVLPQDEKVMMQKQTEIMKNVNIGRE